MYEGINVESYNIGDSTFVLKILQLFTTAAEESIKE